MVHKPRVSSGSYSNPAEDVVGIIPAAGRSRRLGHLPCSKELFPIGFAVRHPTQAATPKVVSQYLLEQFRKAGVSRTYIVIRDGKWDIPQYFGDGHDVGMNLAYVVIPGSSGPPDTIDRAYPFVKDKIVAFGFPDIIFRPTDVFAMLLSKLGRHSVDVVLGLFPAQDSKAMDMIDIDASGRVRALELKPRKTRLQYAWLCAVWTPVFTEFLHQFLQTLRRRPRARLVGNRRIDPGGDIPVGAVLRAAVRAKLHIEGVIFPTGTYIDIGTPDDLTKAIQLYR